MVLVNPPYQWRFDARAVTPVEMIVFNAEDLHGQFNVDHELGFELLKRFIAVITQRLEAERLQLVSLYGAHT